MDIYNFFGLDEADLETCRQAVAEAPPMTNEQAWEIGRICGWIPMERDPDGEGWRPLPQH
ncbi:hypothetical protein [Mycobacterium terramassiliense]|uniref:hypothetical protein n=1 Tax=Mycobacterium terramassiliense TaxID=1841859 RepID=UPI00097D34E9|nr:hypothetical protein [Mycobacterium terramassiliense]